VHISDERNWGITVSLPWHTIFSCEQVSFHHGHLVMPTDVKKGKTCPIESK
jgi:hypothetical protein